MTIERPSPPYPSDTLAGNYRFELDIPRITASDTWALGGERLRPYLLMLWVVAWNERPCGSLPVDAAVIAAKLGLSREQLLDFSDVLLRGWVEHSDGRMYHPVVTERVLEMVKRRNKWQDRQADYRGRSKGVSRETHGGVTEESRGSNVLGIGIGIDVPSEHLLETPTESLGLNGVEPPPQVQKNYRIPDCPVQAIVADYNDICGSLPRCEIVSDHRAGKVRARWREVCVKDKCSAKEAREVFRAVFKAANGSKFLTGRVTPQSGRKPFRADLEWLLTPTYFTKVLEGRYE